MNNFSRLASNSIAIKAAVAAASLTVLATTASAQASAYSNGQQSFSFAIDPNSAGQDLQVSDNGLGTYNLLNRLIGSGPYVATLGTGVASTTLSPSAYYDNSAWQGYVGTESSASSGANGYAKASLGNSETLILKDLGPDAITIDVSASGFAFASVGAVPPATASVDTYVGIWDFNLSTFTQMANPVVHISGTAASGLTTDVTGWSVDSGLGVPFYDANYVMTINPGETHFLEFYTSGQATAVAPSPAAAIPMVIGFASCLIRRRKSA